MRKIYKYKLGYDGEVTEIKGHIIRFLDVQFQPGEGIVVWADTNDSAKEITIKVIAVGTGWPIPDGMIYWDYIGTAQDGMGFVWHYYAEPFHNPDRKEMNTLANTFFGGLTAMEGKQPNISNEEINRIVDEWNAVPERYYV